MAIRAQSNRHFTFDVYDRVFGANFGCSVGLRPSFAFLSTSCQAKLNRYFEIFAHTYYRTLQLRHLA